MEIEEDLLDGFGIDRSPGEGAGNEAERGMRRESEGRA